MKRSVRLLGLIPKPLGISPGQRFRIEQWAPLLRRDHGIDVEFAPFESPALSQILNRPGALRRKAALTLADMWRRRRILREASRYDGVFVYREAALLGPPILEWLLAHRKVPIVYDFDDAIWTPAGSVNGLFSRLRFPKKTGRICSLASVVTVGNEYLAAYARRFARRVQIVPTTIPLDRYPLSPPPRGNVPTIVVWSGSSTTLMYLEMARDPIERLAQTRKVHVRVVCNHPPERPFSGVENEFIPWNEDSEARAIGGAHMGLMPLPDDEFARGKCALKALQYMAVGVPVILSPVGVNAQVVQDGTNGLWAQSPEEWYRAMTLLATRAEWRRKLAAAGRKTVEERFSAPHGALQLAEAIRGALAGSELRNPPGASPAPRSSRPAPKHSALGSPPV